MWIPRNTKLYEISLATFWLDENGILCGVTKDEKRTLELYKEYIELLKKLTKNGHKLCLLIDTSDSMPMSKEVTDYITKEMPKYIKAEALISRNPVLGTISNAITKFNASGFPIKKCGDEKEAKEWLKQFL